MNLLQRILQYAGIYFVIAALLTLATMTAVGWTVINYNEVELETPLVQALGNYADALESGTTNGKAMGAAMLFGLHDDDAKKAVLGTERPNAPSFIKTLDTLRDIYALDTIFVTNKQGIIVAYSSDDHKAGVGLDMSSSPYIQLAMQGTPNVYPAVSLVSNDRGIYLAAPVYATEQPTSEAIGTVVYRVSADVLDALIKTWKKGTAVLLSPQGVAFATSRDDWLFRMTGEMNGKIIAEIQSTGQFGKAFSEMSHAPLPFVPAKFGRDTLETQIGSVRYAVRSHVMEWYDPKGNWILSFLEPRTPWWRSWNVMAFASFAGLIAGLGFFWIYYLARNERKREINFRKLEIANQKAAEATLAKSRFLANMSHEIRTPMNAIIGMSHLALKTDLNPRQKDYIEKVYAAAKSLLGIINDILDFSKVEAGKMELERTRFTLEDVASNSLSLMRQRAHEKEIELLFDITDPLLLGECGALLGDALRLGQVLNNLLSNSVKFTHEGYVRLTISTESRTDDNVVLRFCVRDTGIGVTAEQVGNLFQEFSQADGSTTRKYGGTGLGLSISKKFVEMMDGNIWVESKPNDGSCFYFTARFPIAKPVPLAPVVLPGADELRVLVVDDQPEALLVLLDLLTTLGIGAAYEHGVDCATGGKEALVMITKAIEIGQPYNLMLLDWIMPGMDGSDVLQALKVSGLVNLPLPVVVSAFDSESMHGAAERLGAEHFLPKPVLPKALRNLLNILSGGADDLSSVSQDRSTDRNFNGMRVLLVEDNPINQQLAVELLESRSIMVVVANNGQEALDRLAEVAPDHYHLVFMDLQMPVMDGYEATRRLRADPRYFSLPLVAMTAHAMVEERDRCLALGMNGHLSKPIEPDDLYAMIALYYTAPSDADLAMTAVVQRSASPVSPEGDPPAELPNIPGLDTVGGLRRAGNKHKLYLQMLAEFARDYTDYSTTFAHHFANGQWQEAERLAHTIKGLAATLGAKVVQLLAWELEASCKNRKIETAAADLSALTPQLTPLLAALQQHFTEKQAATESTTVADTSVINTGKIPECLPQLRKLLSEGDSDVIELWEHHQKEFTHILSPEVLQGIGTALQNFEFDAAELLLAELPANVHPE